MPLSNEYGVVIGSVNRHFINPPDSQGRWPQYHIIVNTPAGKYECVINLKSRTAIKIQYKHYEDLNRKKFLTLLERSNGFYPLASHPESGALDVIRHKHINNSIFYWLLPKWIREKFFSINKCKYWEPENGNNVIEIMKSCMVGVTRVYIFGEPYETGLGIHNVHMNQGDPMTGSFAKENGIWQDGGIMFEYETPHPRLAILLTKFQTQSLQTDEDGRPL